MNITDQFDVPAGQTGTMSYDNAGNLTTDTYTDTISGKGTRVYDAENRMTRTTDASGNQMSATYTMAKASA